MRRVCTFNASVSEIRYDGVLFLLHPPRILSFRSLKLKNSGRIFYDQDGGASPQSTRPSLRYGCYTVSYRTILDAAGAPGFLWARDPLARYCDHFVFPTIRSSVRYSSASRSSPLRGVSANALLYSRLSFTSFENRRSVLVCTDNHTSPMSIQR